MDGNEYVADELRKIHNSLGELCHRRAEIDAEIRNMQMKEEVLVAGLAQVRAQERMEQPNTAITYGTDLTIVEALT